MTPAGAHWCSLFPTSTQLSDLIDPFRSSCLEFISDLEANGGKVVIAATYRPPERAYLMHWSYMIARAKQAPECIAPMPGVDILWDCGDPAATIAGCEEMVKRYEIVVVPALVSRHTQRRAIDMTISGVVQGQALYDWGRKFGVNKYVADPPHWSDDGH